MINIKEQIGGAEWLDTKCVILIFVTLGLVLFYGRDAIKGLIGFFANSGTIFKSIFDSFKMASAFALEGTQMKCEKTNVKDNCPKLDKMGNKIGKKKKKTKKWDKNNCPVEAFSLPDRCTDDKYRFIGSDGNCYKNILDADKLKGEYCSINGGGGNIPTCNKYSCPGNSGDGDLQDSLGLNKQELEMKCKMKLIDAQKDLGDEDGIINQINIGKSKRQYKELPAHLNNCSTIGLNYRSFNENTGGKFNFIPSGKNGPPHVMRSDENTGWNHDLTLLCSEKVFTDRTFYDELDGGGWILVRRSYGQWHKATDNLYKNSSPEKSVYGDFKNSDSLSGNYSRMPPIEDYNQFLIANDDISMGGTPSKWMIINKDDLHKNNSRRLIIQSSSKNKEKHNVIFDNGNNKDKPHISLTNIGNDDRGNVLYIENEYGGKGASKNYDNIYKGGVNVFVRKYTNWTQNGTAKATQNSTGWGGIPKKAIDNNTDQRWRGNSITHTYANRYAWWQVDLGRDYPINKIEIFGGWEPNVSWNNGKRLRYFNVTIDGDIVKQVGDVHSRVHTVNINPAKKGRIVKIQFNNFNSYLMLSEVKVWGVNMNREDFTPKIERFTDSMNVDDGKEEFVAEIMGDRKPEVFNIDKQYFKYDQAEKACNFFGGTLATEDELKKAYRKGAHWCNPGWVKGGKVMYPIQGEYYNKFSKNVRDQNMCGPGPGVHEKANIPNLEYGVNCIGIKPAPDPSRIIMGVDEYKEEDIQKKMNMTGVHVNPYSPKRWSKTSMMPTGYSDIPTGKENFTVSKNIDDEKLSQKLLEAISKNF